ncbi:hypothetical protein AAVH_34358 [Aphelenchoides avenae]|nr:hypothetical protein AAVH_34358 [Aphelenchus avenae]
MQRLDERNGFPIAKALDELYGDVALGYMLTIRGPDRPDTKMVLGSDAATFATGGVARVPGTTKNLELYVLF